MLITIKEDGIRFGARVGAIIFNSNKTKVFVQKQKHDLYMFPGGRIEIGENSFDSIKRELKEELGIEEEIELKYVVESFIKYPNLNYHEIGFYFITQISEEKYKYFDNVKYNSLDELNDGKSEFFWIDIKELKNYNLNPRKIIEELEKKVFNSNEIKHLINYD